MPFLPKKLNPSLPNKQTVQQIVESSDWFRAVTAFFVFACGFMTYLASVTLPGIGSSCRAFPFFPYLLSPLFVT